MEDLLQIVDSPEMNELHCAVLDNRLEAVKYLVKNGADISNTIDGGQTPLHLATTLNYHSIMEELIRGKPYDELQTVINAKVVGSGAAALHVAAKNNSLEGIRLLLSYGANFEMADDNYHISKILTSEKSIKDLIENVEKIFDVTLTSDDRLLQNELNGIPAENWAATMYARNGQRFTILQLAMDREKIDALATIVNFRIEKLKRQHCLVGAKLDALMQHSKAARRHLSNLDAFHCRGCIDSCKKEVIEFLHSCIEFLEACKEPDRGNFRNRPLLAIIEETLQYFFGSRKAYEFIEMERLHRILSKGTEFSVKLLKLSIMAPMLLFMKSVYSSELLNAAKNNDLSLVQKCLMGHPSLNNVDVDNWTALHHAFYHLNNEMAKLLLHHGADPIANDTNNKNSSKGSESHLLLSLQQQQYQRSPYTESKHIEIEVVKLLLQSIKDDNKRADYIDARTDGGATALHLAEELHNVPLIICLLSQGFIYCPKNKNGCRPKCYVHAKNAGNVITVGIDLFQSIDHLFAHALEGHTQKLLPIIGRLVGAVDSSVVTGTRNAEGFTLLEVLDRRGLTEATDRIKEMLAAKPRSVNE